MQIDDEMEGHYELLKEIQDFPTDINAIVARRRKDFTGEFFRYLSLIADTYDSLEDRDGNCIQVLYFYLFILFLFACFSLDDYLFQVLQSPERMIIFLLVVASHD